MKFFHRKPPSPEESLEPLLWQLRDLAQMPPVTIDLYVWERDIDAVMKQIRALSKRAYEQLEDLVLELEKRGIEHVRDLDNNEPPEVMEESHRRYFEQLAFLTSELQAFHFPESEEPK